MDIYSSDEDIDLAIAHAYEQPAPREPRQFHSRQFDEDISEKTFRERYRVPREVLNILEAKLSQHLQHPTSCNQSLAPREQIKIFLHYIGTNSFYHVLRDCHGVGTDTIFRSVHRVCDLIFDLRADYIKWPENSQDLARQFYDVAHMPCANQPTKGRRSRIRQPASHILSEHSCGLWT